MDRLRESWDKGEKTTKSLTIIRSFRRRDTETKEETVRKHNEVKELRLLVEVLQMLDDASTLSDNLDKILETIARHTGMMRGVITLLDESHGEIAIEVAYGLSREAQNRGRYKLGEGITGKVIATGQPLIVPDISAEPLFLNRTGSRTDPENISFICVPIKMEGQVIGALSADRLFASSNALDEDMRLLTILASLIARAVRTRQLHHRVLEENKRLQNALRERSRPQMFVGNSSVLQDVLTQVARVAPTDATVLLLGESGTGKELTANTIHAGSSRAGQPFIKINCAALPESLIESELFGHEKGAFTGAIAIRKGRFEAADGGTLFLDEIGELAVSTQVKLLRVLQEQEFERLGGSKTIRVDVRLIAATSRNLERMVAEGAFRQDLYYRLNVFPVRMPPLRERLDDIPLLVASFLEKYGQKIGKRSLRLTPKAQELLLAHSWPGNIRELQNIIERAVILTTDGQIHASHLPPSFQLPAPALSLPHSLSAALEELEQRLIREALEAHHGNICRAAQSLGITERIMGLRMKKFGLTYKQFRSIGQQKSPIS